MIIAERVAAEGFDAFVTRLNERMIGHVKRKFGDDDIAQRTTADIDAFPKTRGAEEHGSLALAKLTQQLTALAIFAVDKHGMTRRAKNRRATLRHFTQRAKAGEEHKRTAAGFINVRQYARNQLA